MALSEEDELDVDLISLVSGINRDHLQKMLDGEVYPSEWHVRQLRRVVGSDQLDEFLTHDLPDVKYISTRYGRPPEDSQLMAYIPARELRVGDYIQYKPFKHHRGLSWIQISEIEPSGPFTKIWVGDVSFQVKSESPVRIARPTEKSDIAAQY